MSPQRLEKNLGKLSAAELFARYEEADQEYIKGFVPESEGERGRVIRNQALGDEWQGIVDEIWRRQRSKDREVLNRFTENLKSILRANESGVRANRRTSNVGANIRRFRKELGWSSQKLAAESGIDKKQVLSHENGTQPHPKNVALYADTFTRGFTKKKGIPTPITVQDLER